MITALIIGVGGCVAFQHAKPFLLGDGCQVTVAGQVVQLDSEQAAIAATIAGVGYRHGLPSAAVTVAYATALQESHLHDVDYGDRDSVGIFQQRPSQGWGTPSQLMDPVYATTKFFSALVRVPGYLEMPVYRAAQAVQHSADGTAYGQYEQVAEMLSTAFTGDAPRAVSCWYTAYSKRTAQFTAAMSQVSRTFGLQGAGGGATFEQAGGPVTAETAAHQLAVPVPGRQAGWAVAIWSVAHAKIYGIRQVRYAGYEWHVSSGERGWRHTQGAPATAVQLG
jgi:hypothetical protein